MVISFIFLAKGESMKHLVVLAFLMVASAGRSATIHGVNQTWTYDPVTNNGTLHIVNVSHKEITALDVGVRVTQADGTVDIVSERATDLLPLMISVTQSSGQLKDVTGSGAFAPGETRNEVIAADGKTEASVDVVIYSDGTTEIDNQRAFDLILGGRKQQILALQQVNEIVQKNLADSTVSNHRASIEAELNREAAVYRGKNENYLDVALRTAISQLPKDDSALTDYVKRNTERIAAITPHTKLQAVQP
jgi:hypothetical protein